MFELLPWCFAVSAVDAGAADAVARAAWRHRRAARCPGRRWRYIGLIAGPFGTWCVMQATATLPTVVSSVGFLTTPAISLILANLFLGEPITADLLAGSALIIGRRRLRRMAGATAMMLHAIEAGHGEPPLVLLHGLFGSARNFGTVQREFARQRRTIALDLRNHGASPHDADMRYAAWPPMCCRHSTGCRRLPAILLGHSMGGKVAMQAGVGAARRGCAADRRRYRAGGLSAALPRLSPQAMAALPLSPGMTRADADAALADAVPDAGDAGVPAAEPAAWRDAGVAHRAARDHCRALPTSKAGMRRPMRAIPARRCSSPAPRRTTSSRSTARHPRAVSQRTLRDAEECRPLAACRQSGGLRRRGRGFFDSTA